MSNRNLQQSSSAELVASEPTASATVLAHARYQTLFRVGILAFVLAFVVFGGVLLLTDRLTYESLGYPVIWVISLIGAGSIILPVPGLVAVCGGAAPEVGLNPLLIGLVAGSAEALGEMTGYLAGLSGNTFLERQRLYPKFRDWLMRHGGIVLFLLSVIPNPVFDLVGIAAGGARYPVKKFLVLVFLGKSVKSSGIAYGCYFGVGFIQDLVENVF